MSKPGGGGAIDIEVRPPIYLKPFYTVVHAFIALISKDITDTGEKRSSRLFHSTPVEENGAEIEPADLTGKFVSETNLSMPRVSQGQRPALKRARETRRPHLRVRVLTAE